MDISENMGKDQCPMQGGSEQESHMACRGVVAVCAAKSKRGMSAKLSSKKGRPCPGLRGEHDVPVGRPMLGRQPYWNLVAEHTGGYLPIV